MILKMYGFYDDSGILIDKIPAIDIKTAKEIFEKENPEVKYLYVEVLY